MFKIRRNSDGLFSTGGTFPSFQKGGKTWNTESELQKHIDLVQHGRWNETYAHPIANSWAYDDTEVVAFEMNVKNVDSTKKYRRSINVK